MKPEDQQTLLLAVYKENCEQERHHENQREKVTAIVAQTTGVMLGLLALGKGASEMTGSASYLIPAFIIILGFWGFSASWKHNERSRLHRTREVTLLKPA